MLLRRRTFGHGRWQRGSRERAEEWVLYHPANPMRCRREGEGVYAWKRCVAVRLARREPRGGCSKGGPLEQERIFKKDVVFTEPQS